ncbi:MAG: phage tail assembly chaperone [Bacillota bacterium]|jgi:hypothetical protein
MEKAAVYTDLSSFFHSRVRGDLRQSVIISERFWDKDTDKPTEFVIRGISEAENEAIKAAARRPAFGEGQEYRFDNKNYCNRLIVAATVYPNFKNLELQRDWGALNAEDLVCKMLLAGEYAKLLAAVKKLSGFDENIYELKNIVKN